MATKKTASKGPDARKKKNDSGPISIEAVTHDDKRINIPTADLAARLSESKQIPPNLYPRDISLDPQLVWRGKDHQDSADLTVPVVPIYIQEKIDPRVIVENLRDTADDGKEPELTLFDNFDGLDGTQMLEFYEHEGNWSNQLILGDSLLAMNSLASLENLAGKVQMIYFDPPYGISFGSNWQVSTRNRDVQDGKVVDITRQPEQVKAFRDTWDMGIHSYLTYLRDRLVVARELLNDTGSIFVQIGEENNHLVRNLMDEVFGSNCAVVTLLVKKTGSKKATMINPVNDYILWYSKMPKDGSGGVVPKFRALYEKRELDEATIREFSRVEIGNEQFLLSKVAVGGEQRDYRSNVDALFKDFPSARLFRAWPVTNGGERPNQMDPVELEGTKYFPPKGYCWGHTSKRRGSEDLSGMERLRQAGRLISVGKTIDFKRYLDDFPYKQISNWWDGLGGASNPTYVVQTNTEIVKRCILMTTDPGDLVLDPTCGSGTTAYVAEWWARRWITIDTSRVALSLAKTRIMTAQFPYFMLADSSEAVNAGFSESSNSNPSGNVKRGLVCETAKHITSGVFANCLEINENQGKIEAERAAIASAPVEQLVDRPLVIKNKVRVAGRFVVESLSPHRSLNDAATSVSEDNFAERILGHLARSGVQNTFKEERLEFDRLDAYPGEWLNGEGEYTNADGETKRVAVAIGPEFGTVSADLVREAAIEASDGRGFEILIICGLAFDPLVGEQAKKFGRLVVLPTKINPDLTMPDGLLKNTGTGNLFTVFGEPDIEIVKSTAGKIAVKVNGVDIYDPTTGVVRSGSVDDIACWFIDSNYDQKSFFVRHAYFTGGNKPYESLSKTLRTEIDVDAWSALYSNESQPFDPPSSGRIAVKVINHFGDEVMQVYQV